jgi:hypothetical protein
MMLGGTGDSEKVYALPVTIAQITGGGMNIETKSTGFIHSNVDGSVKRAVFPGLRRRYISVERQRHIDR